MFSALRVLVCALLGVALTSQLLQGQAMSCVQMEIGATSMTSEQTDHSGPCGDSEAGASVVPAGSDTQTGMPHPSTCILAANCVSAPALPTSGQMTVGASPVTSAIAYGTASPEVATPRPEIPPPRL